MTQQSANSAELQDLYRQLILDHARSPRHFGRLGNATHTAQGINPLCGDKLRLYLCVDGDERIEASSFEGTGCAISVASASLLTDTITGLSVKEARTVFRSLTARLTEGPEAVDPRGGTAFDVRLAKLKALDGVRQYPSRVKCATLAWHALHSALHGAATTATTE